MSAIEVYDNNAGAVVAADQWGRERIELIKRTYCKGATDDELALFVATCQRTGLSPEARQIFAVKRRENVDGSWTEVMSTQTSIDGYRLIAQRSNEYAGQIPKQWCGEDGRWVDVWLKQTPPAAAKAGVHRQGFAEPLVAIATYHEYVQTKKGGEPTNMWATKPALMLAKCAEALALRAAFPAELSGLYTQEEMGQAQVVESRPVPSRPANDDGEPTCSAELGEQVADLQAALKEAGEEWADRGRAAWKLKGLPSRKAHLLTKAEAESAFAVLSKVYQEAVTAQQPTLDGDVA